MKSLVVFVLILVAAVQSVDNTQLYVQSGGNDDNACNTQATACQSVAGAVAKGNNNTINVGTGVYSLSGRPIIINQTSIGYSIIGQSQTQTILSVDPNEQGFDGPVFVLFPVANGTLTITNVRILLNVNHTTTLIGVSPGNRNVTLYQVTVVQTADLTGCDLITVGGANVTLNNVTFENITSGTVAIYNREPQNNSTVELLNVRFSNWVISNALYYDYGWNNHTAHVKFTNVNVVNFTTPEGQPGFGGQPHPGLFDFDLVNCDQKTFEMTNCNFTNINLNFTYAAPIFFSVEWQMRWVQPTFSFTNVTFTNNSAREAGAIAVDSRMQKDFVRLSITGCQFYLNTPAIKRPGQVSDLSLGGPSHTYANISYSCSLSCLPRVDSDAAAELLPNCTSGTQATNCTNYISQTNVYVSSSNNASDDAACTATTAPCASIEGAVNKGNNLTVNIGSGWFECPTVFVNVLNDGYKLIGAASPINQPWNTQTQLLGSTRPNFLVLFNDPGLFLHLVNLHFEINDTIPDWLIISMSAFGLVNISEVQFSKTPMIDQSIRVQFIRLFKGNVILNEVRFNFIQSDDTLISHEGFFYNTFNATNVNITNLELTGGRARIFDDLESEEDGLAFNFINVTVENVTRERSSEHGYNFALFEFSGTSFSEEFTPQVTFDNCTFRNIYVATDSLILFDVPKEPIFINCTFTNNTARYAGAITAIADGAFIRLYGCQFFANRGSIPMESFSDINIGPDALMYTPQDFRQTCSRSCQPRTAFTLFMFFMDCQNETDKDGQGRVDPATCPPYFTDLYVNLNTGNDTNPCTANSAPCLTLFGAIFKGMNNRIHISAGEYVCPPVVIGDVQEGFALIGNSQYGNATRTQLTIDWTEHLFELRNYPMVYLFLERVRIWMNVSSQSPRYLINIATTEDYQGFVDVMEVQINHAENVTGCNFLSMNSGRVVLTNVTFHGLETWRPLVLCLNHFFFGNNSLWAHNVTIGNITERGMGSLFDSGGFSHENYTLMRIENITSTLDAGNRSFGALFRISDDVSRFNFSSSVFRNLYLGAAYQAPIIFHNITENREFRFINVTFTNNTAEFAGAIMMHETSSIKLRIFDCFFYNNTALNPRGANDLFLDWDKGLYTPFDIGFSCSRSCAPRINIGPLIVLIDCLNETDIGGYGKVDTSTCTSTNSVALFVVASGGSDNNDCLTPQKACSTIGAQYAKGWNNAIIAGPGKFNIPPVTINQTNTGYQIVGRNHTGPDVTDLYINVAGTIYELTDSPGAYLLLGQSRYIINASRTSYFITVAAQFDFRHTIEIIDIVYTQVNSQAFVGTQFLSFYGGNALFRNVLFTGLVGDEPLFFYEGHVYTFNPYLVNFFDVNITNIKLSGANPLYFDDDNQHTHINVGFENCLVENISVVGGSVGTFGLFNFVSNSTYKPVDIFNSTFRYLTLGNAYYAPIYYYGNYGENRAVVNSTFAHNTGAHCGGISDANQDEFRIRILFSHFFGNRATGPGGVSDLQLGVLSDKYSFEYIIASCGNSNQPRISGTQTIVASLIGNCDEPVPPPNERDVEIITKKKVSGGAIAAIVILVLLVVAAITVGVLIFLWYRKKKSQGYEFIGPDKKKNSVNNNEFDVEGRK